MLLFVVVIAFPMALILRKSFSVRGIGNYVQVLQTGILRNVANSLIISLGTIAIVLVLILPSAYAFSKFRFRFSGACISSPYWA